MAAAPPSFAEIAPRGVADLLTARPAATALLFALVLWLANPVGYIGGGGDEYQYLIAARCTAEHGFCLPVDHWWRRWPIVAPSALVIRLLGEGYVPIALVPLAYALASVALLATVVTRQFGRVAGTLAAAVFAATPLVAELALEMGIDVPEFLFALAAVALIQRGYERSGIRWAALAGLAAGLAIQARPTGLALLPIFIGLFVLTNRHRWILPFMVTAAVPNLIEAVVYVAAAGDPLLGWKLSLAHNRIPSSELLPTVDPTHSPLFNPEYIGGWRRPLGIEVHWLVDGLLNYLLNPAVAITLVAGLLLLALEWRRAMRRDSALLCAVAIGVLWFGALTYGFAIDPKPRMFLPTLAVAATLFGVIAPQRWEQSKALIGGLFALILMQAAIAGYQRSDLRTLVAAAPTTIRDAGPGLFADPITARYLALVPAARALPLFANRADQRKLLLIGQTSCTAAAQAMNYRGWRPVRATTTPPGKPPAVMCVMVR